MPHIGSTSKTFPDPEKNIHYIFREGGDGFEVMRGKSFSHVAWENVRKVIERPRYFRFDLNQYDRSSSRRRFLLHGADEQVIEGNGLSPLFGPKAKLLG